MSKEEILAIVAHALLFHPIVVLHQPEIDKDNIKVASPRLLSREIHRN